MAKRILAAAAVLAGLAAWSGSASAQSLADVLHSQRAEGGRMCLLDHTHAGSGSGPTRAAAEREAIASYSGFTAFEYGNEWGSYRLAGSKKMDCSQAGIGWSCSLEARPCRPLKRGDMSASAVKRTSKQKQ